MTCTDVQQALPDLIDGSEDAEFQSHLKSCPLCAELVADLNLIVGEARELAESEEPPARVWVQISNQLRSEGIIRDTETVPGRPVLVPAPARRWNAWWLAPVAAAVIAAGAYQLIPRKTAAEPPQVAQQQAGHVAQPDANQQATQGPEVAHPPQGTQSAATAKPSGQLAQDRASAPASNPAQSAAGHPQLAGNARIEREISPPPSAEDQRFLTQVSERTPGMRTTYESQLRAVNGEISETQLYIQRHPGDQDARQHLLEVYQQKTMLYQMALDHIQ
ncbi:MAG: hypothetical protein WAL71_05085 [Terriglobales bacterium]